MCPECGVRLPYPGKTTCFQCHIRGIGFSFVGGGGYGRSKFHARTNAEFIRDTVGDPKNLPPNVEPMPR